MPLPPFMDRFPSVALPLPDTMVATRAMRTEHGLAVFFSVKEDVELPPHSHGAQWGTVIEGSLILTMNGETRTYRAGESYDILAGTVHAASVPAGSLLLDVFEEADRYALKAN